MPERPRPWLLRLRRLTADEVRLLIQASALLFACQIRRWRSPVGELLGAEPRPSTATFRPRDLAHAKTLGWAICRAARYGPVRPRCLVRSLALQELMRRHGIFEGEIRLGVRRQNGAFEAHAWVELYGHVIGDSAEYVRRFTPTADHRLVPL